VSPANFLTLVPSTDSVTFAKETGTATLSLSSSLFKPSGKTKFLVSVEGSVPSTFKVTSSPVTASPSAFCKVMPVGNVAEAKEEPPSGVASATMSAVVVEPLIAVETSASAARPSSSVGVSKN
jgi:hypothetical protein